MKVEERREERALPNGWRGRNGGDGGVVTPSGQRQCQSQILSDFHFSVHRGRREKSGEKRSHATSPTFAVSIFSSQNRAHRSTFPRLFCSAQCWQQHGAFGRISLMRDDGGGDGDNSDVESGGGRERGNKDEEHKKQMERSKQGIASMFMLCQRERVM